MSIYLYCYAYLKQQNHGYKIDFTWSLPFPNVTVSVAATVVTALQWRNASAPTSLTPPKSIFVRDLDYDADIWFNNKDRSLAVDVIANDANLQVGESMIIGNVKGAEYKINAKSPIEIKITRESDGLIIEQFQGPVPFKLLSEN